MYNRWKVRARKKKKWEQLKKEGKSEEDGAELV
jgi:hypothetical protein